MSAASSEFGATERRSGPEPPEESLSRQAKLYLFSVAALAVVLALVPLSHLKPGSHGWPTFLVLASCAAIAQLFVVRTPRDQSYHTTIVFLIPAAMLLPPELVALMGVVQHIPEWLKVRYPWYIQGFNIANYTLNGLAAWGAVQVVESWNLNPDVTFALGGLAASVVFVTLNHVLLATMLHFARGHTLRETGLFSAESLSTDFVLAALGVAFAAIWTWNPWLLPTAVAPLLLIHRSLSVPALQEEARVDPKTGLFNARYFTGELREELARAGRMDRPMSTSSGTSTTRTAISPATPSSRASRRSSASSCAITTFQPASVGRSSPFSCRKLRRSRLSRSRSASGGRLPTGASRWRRRASRSAPRSPSASRVSPRTGPTRTNSSTRPTSPSTGQSSRAETVSRARAASRCSFRRRSARPGLRPCPRKASTRRSSRVPSPSSARANAANSTSRARTRRAARISSP